MTLAEIKADAGIQDIPLVRISRLSVMPVTDAEWGRIDGWRKEEPSCPSWVSSPILFLLEPGGNRDIRRGTSVVTLQALRWWSS